MPRGGFRAKAGRPKGAKNKLTIGFNHALQRQRQALRPDASSLDVLTAVMNDGAVPMAIRLRAAAALMPYVHQRMGRERSEAKLGNAPMASVVMFEAIPRPGLNITVDQ